MLGIKKNLDSPDVITERETTKGGKESSRPNVPVHHLQASFRPFDTVTPPKLSPNECVASASLDQKLEAGKAAWERD